MQINFRTCTGINELEYQFSPQEYHLLMRKEQTFSRGWQQELRNQQPREHKTCRLKYNHRPNHQTRRKFGAKSTTDAKI